MSDAAFAAGYEFTPQHIARDVAGAVERHGTEATERAWGYWVNSAAKWVTHPRFITPKAFASRSGYWVFMSGPA